MSSPISTADLHDEALLARLRAMVAESPVPEAAISEILQALQKARGYIDDEALQLAATMTGLSPVKVEELCTFYSLLLREPVGIHVMRVCDSIACHMAGAQDILAQARQHCGVEFGEVSRSGKLTVIPHVCIGMCDRAPALMVDDEALGPMDKQALTRLLAQLEADVWKPS
ncbi:NADH-quinone oxidoreductase subunit NuoE [Acidithiobacillus montserratensis]|uniref:NADH-quinone oxidoreductase subunit NuoE n=1 Tax=Acidithiobacillus montserratensis TaxID=2729135 RepID=A0ACD5HFK1_9PROT|nr:NADH-quinone oxidoreductase subunit NuoE [Acidithiobacillus montserratensis]MBN2680098.1 NADH-quinone oxidoreductase subunit NuoE [Acidithiobacillaceae bacterium]MBU2748999.1 NADH-quinone oxidoreductase subunit NuoE [Acidithiobacillus montserratensis]